MKGKILGFDDASGRGHIAGPDGKRYAFTAKDLLGGKAAKQGDEADFEVNGDAAVDIYITRSGIDFNAAASNVAGAMSGVAGTLGGVAGSVKSAVSSGQVGQSLEGNSALRFVLGRSGVIWAILILLACFLPYANVPGGFGQPGYSYSVMGTYSVAEQVASGARQLQQLGNMFRNGGGEGGPTGLGWIAFSTWVLFLIYAIPALAVLVLVREAQGGSSGFIRVMTAIAALVCAPVVWFVWSILAAMGSGLSPQQWEQIMNAAGGSGGTMGFGFYLMLLSGVLLLLSVMGIVKPPLAYFPKK
jgi:hypothetical protein